MNRMQPDQTNQTKGTVQPPKRGSINGAFSVACNSDTRRGCACGVVTKSYACS